MSGEYSYPAEVVHEKTREAAELRARVKAAEAELEKAKDAMSTMAQRISKAEIMLAHHTAALPAVFDLIDAIACMPERPSAHTVRTVRSLAARVRIAFNSKGIDR